MKKISKWFGPMLFGAVLAAGAFAPATSEATSTINTVTVTSTIGADSRSWCIVGCAVDPTGGIIWGAAAGTVLNGPGEAGALKNLVLAQTTGFNFDTSEHVLANGTVVTCNTAGGTTCTMTLVVNGINIPLALNNVLNNGNADPGGTVHNEAADFSQIFTGAAGGFNVSIGYADNAHSGACADASGDCLPSPFSNTAATKLVGAAGGTAGGGGCDHGIAPCWDSGVILITANDPQTTKTPEPASMLLLGAGLVGLATWNRKRRQQ